MRGRGIGGPGTEQQVDRIDPSTNRVLETIAPAAPCCGRLVFGRGAVWQEDTAGGTTVRIDPARNEVVATIEVGGTDLAVGEGRVWVLDAIAGTLRPINPRTNAAGRPIPLSGSPTAIAAGEGPSGSSMRPASWRRSPSPATQESRPCRWARTLAT
jgi:DNA-binding beta-propeller fold protein YncE